MLLRIIYIVVLWVFVDQVFLDSEGLYQIPDLTALDTRHNIFISGLFSHSRTFDHLAYSTVDFLSVPEFDPTMTCFENDGSYDHSNIGLHSCPNITLFRFERWRILQKNSTLSYDIHLLFFNSSGNVPSPSQESDLYFIGHLMVSSSG